MKSVFEPEDIQVIVDNIINKLKPYFSDKPPQPNNLMNTNDLCAYLKVSKQWVYERTHLKLIPHIKLSNKELRFRKKDIDAWLESKKTPVVEQPKMMCFLRVV